MHYCEVVSLTTSDQYLLNGLLFGREQSDTGYIFIHGLSSSVFSLHNVLLPLMNNTSRALYFNNRGHDTLGKVRKIDPLSEKGYTSEIIGSAHEVFTDCVFDIQAAVDLLLTKGVKNIFLVGHSTGCQKIVYYLNKQTNQAIKGAVLICPISDYSYAIYTEGKERVDTALIYAKKLIDKGTSHNFMPSKYTTDVIDAQRYVSLHAPDSEEEIFSYAQTGKIPNSLQTVKLPTLVLLAGKDEYGDRPMSKIKLWFEQKSGNKHLAVQIIPESVHGLNGQEHTCSQAIKAWVISANLWS